MTRRVGPSFLTFNEKQTTMIGVDQLTLHAFEMAVNAVKSTMLERTGQQHIGAEGTKDLDLARLMSMSFTLFDDTRSPPGTAIEPLVYGCYVLFPISLVDKAIGKGQDALKTLLLDGVERAEKQPESEDNLGPVSYAGDRIMTIIEDAFSEPAGKRAWRAEIARSASGTPPSTEHTAKRAGDYWVAIATGNSKAMWNAIFGEFEIPLTQEPLDYMECLSELPEEQALSLHQAMLRTGSDRQRELSQNQVVTLAKLAARLPNIRNSGIRNIVDVLSYAQATEFNEAPQFGETRIEKPFVTAAAVWNQSQGRTPQADQTLLLASYFLNNYKLTLKKQLVQGEVEGDTAESWRATSEWFQHLPENHRTTEVLKIADAISPGIAGVAHFPSESVAFLDAMFPKHKYSKKGEYPHPSDEVVRETTHHLLSLLKDSKNQARIVDYVKEAIRLGSGPADTLSQSLERMEPELDHYQRNRLMVAPQLALINEMNKALLSGTVRHEKLVTLLDEWWRKRAPTELNGSLFEKAWAEWIKDNDEALLRIRVSSLSRWRRNELYALAQENQASKDVKDEAPSQTKSPRF